MTISGIDAQRRAGIGKDGGCVAPVEHEVEEDAERGGKCTYEDIRSMYLHIGRTLTACGGLGQSQEDRRRRTCPGILGRHEADTCFNPYGP